MAMERYFERDTLGDSKTHCEEYCSYFSGGYTELTGTFKRHTLRGLLVGKFLNGPSPIHGKFVEFSKDNMEMIFEEGNVPTRLMGPIHTLCLQLVAKGIIDLTVGQEFKCHIGTNKLTSKHIVVKMGTQIDDDSGIPMPIILEDALWKGMSFL